MKLIRIAKSRWDVLAICDSRDNCQVLDFLADHVGVPAAKRMLAMLREYVPINGPPAQNENMSKHLDGDIYEFKRGPKRGKKFRVLYFFDQGNVIVCTSAFTKGEKTPDGAIKSAKDIRKTYVKEKKERKLNITELGDL